MMQGCQVKDQIPLLEKYTADQESESRIEAVTASWDEFYRNQIAALRRIAVEMRLPRDQAEDVIQEVWLAALTNLHRFRGENAARRLIGWMRKVMFCKVVNAHHRMRRHRARSLDTLAVEPMVLEAAGIELERSTWLAARLEEASQHETLNGRLLCAHFQDGRRIAELVVEVGLTEKAVERRLSRAIDQLRQEAVGGGLHAAASA